MSSEPTFPKAPFDTSALAASLRPALVKFFMRKCRNVAEAEDLAQDVLVCALRHATWQSPEQARGYIFRAAVNRWRDRQRRAATHGVKVGWDDSAPFALDEEIAPDRVLLFEEELHRVVEALEDLNERTRDIFLLIRIERMKQAEIAALFGISVSAVEKHYARALAHLGHLVARSDSR
jgi:RNA polymerase sigma factor (sigma-70 family)